MLILLPLDSNDEQNASLTLSTEAKYWAVIDLDAGKIKKIDFYKTREEIEDFVDVVILPSKNDYCWPFIEENIPVLIAPIQRSIEDIIEAFLFKELYQLEA
ncbi:MAG: hypothetical protein GXO31_06080 [Epsilonproteobacteria bacterium]|nr:hypothetical protein [Campylobacterota bacterium]